VLFFDVGFQGCGVKVVDVEHLTSFIDPADDQRIFCGYDDAINNPVFSLGDDEDVVEKAGLDGLVDFGAGGVRKNTLELGTDVGSVGTKRIGSELFGKKTGCFPVKLGDRLGILFGKIVVANQVERFHIMIFMNNRQGDRAVSNINNEEGREVCFFFEPTERRVIKFFSVAFGGHKKVH